MNGQELSLQAILGYFVVTTMEWLKEKRWFPWISEHTKTVNRIVAALAATAYSLGIHYQFDSTAGTLKISGLHLDPIRDAVLGYVMQQLIYRGAVEKTKDASALAEKESEKKPRRRAAAAGAVVLMAAMMAGACAPRNVAPQLVAAQDAVHDKLASAQDGLDAICRPGVLRETCAPFYGPDGLMTHALRAGKAFSEAVLSERLDGLGRLVEEIGRVVSAVDKLPAGELRTRVLSDLRGVIDEAFKGTR